MTAPLLRRLGGLLLLLPLAAPLAGCDDATPTAPPQALALTFTGLEPLQNGFHYEGWAIVGGQPVSTGKFNVNASGAVGSLSGAPITNGVFNTGRALDGATAVVITVEPNGDTNATPASTKILAGTVANRQASLRASHMDALGNDFASAAGTYLLATPTDGMGTNELSGIWYIDPSSGSPMPGLSLPTLPAGWRYEGWAVFNGGTTPVTTGPFTAADAADAAAPFSGPMAGPPFPGEDFLMNAPAGLAFPTDLSGQRTAVTIEPFPDDSPMPFTLAPLRAMIPSPAAPMTPYAMTQNLGSFPTGTARIQ